MKIFVTYLFIFFSCTCYAQSSDKSIGLSLGLATIGIVDGDLFYKVRNSRFHIGYAYQFNKSKGELVSQSKANYGNVPDGTGDYLNSIDFGYSHIVNKKITIKAEINAAFQNYYTNYIDNRFKGGGYHVIDSTVTTLGYGAALGYLVSEKLELYLGYNSVKQLTFGLRFKVLGLR